MRRQDKTFRMAPPQKKRKPELVRCGRDAASPPPAAGSFGFWIKRPEAES
jgi:hypothetical protein